MLKYTSSYKIVNIFEHHSPSPAEPEDPSNIEIELWPPGAWWTLTEVLSPPSAPILF